MKTLAFAGLVAALAVSPVAEADDIGASSTSPAKPKTRWYGWQNLLAYLATDATVGIGGGLIAASKNVAQDRIGLAMIFSGVALHPLAGATVHWAHHRSKIGGLAVGINLATMAGGALIGAGIGAGLFGAEGCGSQDAFRFCGPGIGVFIGATTGAGIGMLSGAAIDAAALANESVTQDKAAPRISMAPLFGRGFSGVAIGGAF